MSPRKKKTIVCPCLQVSEEEILEAVESGRIKTIQDITRYTEAGGGCTACHPALQQYLGYLPSPSNCCDK